MNTIYTHYKQPSSNNKIFNFKLFFLFILYTVHFFFFGGLIIFSQEANIDPNGYNTFYFQNGNISSEGALKDGKPIDYWKTYYNNNQIKSEGNRKNFLLDSIWKFYNSKGALLNEINYKKNKKEGISKLFDKHGCLKSESNYIENVKYGEEKVYYTSGKIKEINIYNQDKKHGFCYELDNIGRVIRISEYTGGFLRSEEQINRFDEEEKKHGIWKEFYENGKVKWEGDFKHGILDGIVREYNKKGGLKTMNMFVDGDLNEDAKEVKFFELSKEIRPNGSYLIGGYADEMKQGIFREYDSTGVLIKSYKYRNNFKIAEGILDSTGLENGEWKYFNTDGSIKAIGKFNHGKRVDLWLYYHKGGEIEQKGLYVNGLPHGEWRWWYINKQLRRQEYFRYGKEDGESIEYDTIGNLMTKGEFIGGIREGVWFYNINDHKEEGEFRDGLKHGIWIYTYNDGQINFKGEYINGLPIDKHRFYYPNGQLKWEGKYDNGEKEGEWRKFNKEGLIILTIQYKRGVEYKVDGYKIKPAFEAQ